MSKKSWPEAPIDEEGNVLSYPTWDSNMVEVEPFHDTASFLHFTRGRSSALAMFQRTDGTSFPMFLSNLHEAIPYLEVGRLTGRFRYVKKGANYGVAFTP